MLTIDHKPLRSLGFLEKDGAAEGTRTPDPIITNDVLYQLSYSGLVKRLLALHRVHV